MSELRIRSAGTRPTYEELEADLRDVRSALNNVMAKEEREAWDRYFAALATRDDYELESATRGADLMLEERRKRWA